MVNLDKPFTFENSSNPWLMDKKDDSSVLVMNGHKLTAAYLWSLNEKERNAALEFVFQHYRINGFPKISFSSSKLKSEFNKLCAYNEENAVTKDGFISNSGNLCIDLCKFFCQEYFYNAKGGRNTLSVKDVFDNDELLIRVLKNRMGWNTTKEGGGKERPYLFPISDKQLLNGIRNSGLGYAVSNFRPGVGKWIYAKAAKLANVETKAKVFDYSGGWGARALAALSLGFDYDVTDPLTSECIRKCINAFKLDSQECNAYDKCSEDLFFRSDEFNQKYDVIGSCPPYFDLEIYSDDEKQSTSTCSEYEKWLEIYWRGTVRNCVHMLKDNGVFVLVIKETIDKHEICKDMCNVLFSEGLSIVVEKYYYKTNTNHLSGKTKSRRSSKTNEIVLFLKRNFKALACK